MKELLKSLNAHKGKTTFAALALATVALFGRGCRITADFDPVKARETTNAVDITTNANQRPEDQPFR